MMTMLKPRLDPMFQPEYRFSFVYLPSLLDDLGGVPPFGYFMRPLIYYVLWKKMFLFNMGSFICIMASRNLILSIHANNLKFGRRDSFELC